MVALTVVPNLRWSATSRWSPTGRSLAVVIPGLWLFGLGDSLMIKGRLGTAPWAALSTGIARHTPFDVGEITIITSFVVLLGWIPLRERPGLGTIANAIIVGTSVKVMTDVLPEPSALASRVTFMLAGIPVVAAGGALYLTTQLGPGPRDGLMTGIAKRLDRPIARVRLTIEIIVLVASLLLGGQVGFGTFVFALTAGHTLAYFLGRLERWAS